MLFPIRNRCDSGGDAANLFGTFCPKEPGLGRLPNKHFCGPTAQQKFRSVATPELLAVCALPYTWREKRRSRFLTFPPFPWPLSSLELWLQRFLVLFRLTSPASHQSVFCTRSLCSETGKNIDLQIYQT